MDKRYLFGSGMSPASTCFLSINIHATRFEITSWLSRAAKAAMNCALVNINPNLVI